MVRLFSKGSGESPVVSAAERDRHELFGSLTEVTSRKSWDFGAPAARNGLGYFPRVP